MSEFSPDMSNIEAKVYPSHWQLQDRLLLTHGQAIASLIMFEGSCK